MEKFNYNECIEKLNLALSPKTVRDIISNLKSILYYAEDKYSCNMKVKKIKSPKLKKQQLTVLSRREVGRLERACLKEDNLASLGIFICVNTGLRIGEICALKWKEIDLEKKEIRVRKTLQRVYNNDKTEIIIGDPKSQTSVRDIPMSRKIYNVLNSIKKNYSDEQFFLTGDEFKYYEPRTYRYLFKDFLKNHKIKTSYKFHILRHTFATNCIEVGMDAKTLSEILGHSSVEITLNKYVHSSYKIKKKFLEKL